MIRINVRSVPTIRGNKVGGYAAVFDEIAERTDLGRERMATGSLDDALKVSDVRALYQHDPRYVLGRQSAGTLRLRIDSTGLEYEADMPDTTYARDLRVLLDRGDITGSSFAFVPDLAEYDDAGRVTTHTRVAELVDVSPVTFPAYSGATAQTRSIGPAAARRPGQLVRARARVHLGGVMK